MRSLVILVLLGTSEDFRIDPQPSRAVYSDLVVLGTVESLRHRAIGVVAYSEEESGVDLTKYYDEAIITVKRVLCGAPGLDFETTKQIRIIWASTPFTNTDMGGLLSPPVVKLGHEAIWMLDITSYPMSYVGFLGSSGDVVPLSMIDEVVEHCASR